MNSKEEMTLNDKVNALGLTVGSLIVAVCLLLVLLFSTRKIVRKNVETDGKIINAIENNQKLIKLAHGL